MRGAWIAAALLGACTSPTGLTIEVVPLDGVTRVELFIARPCEGACPGRVAPPDLDELAAQLFEVDHTRMWGVKVDGDVAGFRITADGTDEQKIPLLAAVGYAGDQAVATAVLTDVKIVPGAADYWRIQLAEAGPLDRQSMPDREAYRVAQWRTADDTLPSCVVIEHAGERLAIGPEADDDCDEVMAQSECKPWSFRASDTAGSIDTANCVTTASVGIFASACLAAGAACNEVSDALATCSRIADDYCLTAALCACPPWDTSCLFTSGFNPAGPYVQCVVPVTDLGEPCSNPTTFTQVSPCGSFGATASSCTSIRLHELGPTIGPFGMSASFGSSTLAITASSAPGIIDLEWSGTPGEQIALVSLDLDNGRHIVMPLQLTFAQPCGGSGYCEVHGDASADAALACATAPTAPATCQPESPCNGPQCGGVCCGSGEQCVSGTCLCGTGPRCTDGECAAGSSGPCGSKCCNGNTGVQCVF